MLVTVLLPRIFIRVFIHNYLYMISFLRSLRSKKASRGFTLIEILVVLGIIAILAAIVIVAINPAKQFAQARNAQRESNVETILNAVGQRLADNKGIFNGSFTIGGVTYTCPTLPSTQTDIKNGGAADLACLYPTYIPAQIPVDPNGGSWNNETLYDTNYYVSASTTGRVMVCAINAASETAVPNPASICVTR